MACSGLHEGNSIAGIAELEAGDIIAPPEELCFGFDWFFGSDYE